MIFRGVSDMPKEAGASDYDRQLADYKANTPAIMAELLFWLPEIVQRLNQYD